METVYDNRRGLLIEVNDAEALITWFYGDHTETQTFDRDELIKMLSKKSD